MIITAMLMLFAQPTPPQPVGDPGSWINTKDYPSGENARGMGGITSVILVVSKSGEVTDCRVGASSGSATLDATACALLKIRGRFKPARDAEGKPIESTYNNRVRWLTNAPDALPIPDQPYVTTIAVDIDKEGVIYRCNVEDAPPELVQSNHSPCMAFPAGKKGIPYMGKDQKKTAVTIRYRQSVEIKPR